MSVSLNRLSTSFDMSQLVMNIDRDDFIDFLDHILNSDNINNFNILLHKLYEKRQAAQTPNQKVDEIFHYLMLFIYYEILSIPHALAKLDATPAIDSTTLLTYYEKVCGLTNSGNAIYRKYFLRDYIVDLYYGRTDILSYKNEDNIKTEFNKIWKMLTVNERKCVYDIMKIQDKDATNDNDIPVNFYKYFTRINDRAALCEDSIEQLSYILNNQYYNAANDLWYVESLSQYPNTTADLLLSVLIKIAEATINY